MPCLPPCLSRTSALSSTINATQPLFIRGVTFFSLTIALLLKSLLKRSLTFQRSSQNATDITFDLNWDFIKTVCAALLVYKSEWVSEWVSCSDSAQTLHWFTRVSEWVSEWVDQTLLRLCTACHRISELLRLYTDFATLSETSFKRLWILWLLRLNTDFTTQRLCDRLC